MAALTGNGKPAERHAASQRYCGRQRRLSVGQHQEKRGLHAETAAVEYLPDAGRGKDAVFPQVIGQDTAEGHHNGHQQVRQRPDVSGLWKNVVTCYGTSVVPPGLYEPVVGPMVPGQTRFSVQSLIIGRVTVLKYEARPESTVYYVIGRETRVRNP